jgi:hypothetical protein
MTQESATIKFSVKGYLIVGILLALFVNAKLEGNIAWSWPVVLIPLWVMTVPLLGYVCYLLIVKKQRLSDISLGIGW